MRKKMIISTGAAILTLVISSCAPSTPATRISKSPAVFEKLSPSDQELAKQGQIKEGMERNAVLIALGEPSKIGKGSKEGKTFEKWYYTNTRPVYRHGVSFGIGYGSYGRRGFGRFGRRGFSRLGYGGFGGYGLNQRVSYVRSLSAVVEFDASGRVKNWSQTQ